MSESSACNFQDWLHTHISQSLDSFNNSPQIVRYVALLSLGGALGFVVKSGVYNSFLNHATEGAYSFVECSLLSVENNPWENKNIVVSCSVFVWFQCLFSFLKLLLSFKINDKKEFLK